MFPPEFKVWNSYIYCRKRLGLDYDFARKSFDFPLSKNYKELPEVGPGMNPVFSNQT